MRACDDLLPMGEFYYGDNLDVLRGRAIKDDSVDLVYLDPPFNSQRSFNVIHKEADGSASEAQRRAFEDYWTMDRAAQDALSFLLLPGKERWKVPARMSETFEMLQRVLGGENNMLAYLAMMGVRLVELRRVMKPTASLYLHCDPTASHYLKLVLDSLFGPTNFRSEIVWKRSTAHSEPSDIVTRFARRADWNRRDLEARRRDELALISEQLSELPLRLYDWSTTIEAAADDLASAAEKAGMRAALFVDSIQTATCEGEKDARSVREAVSARVQALRAVATRHKLIALATSEMGRHAYRSTKDSEDASDLAAAKESGAIEYSARVLLALRSVVGESDLVQLRIGKNKHGPSGEEIFLRLDRRRMQLAQTDAPAKPDVSEVKTARFGCARSSSTLSGDTAGFVAFGGLRVARMRRGGRRGLP